MKHLLTVLNNSMSIDEYSTEELKCLPIDFFLHYVDCMSLLDIWGRFPVDNRRNFELQVRLPCFVHHNRPDWRTHVDGPPTSQNRCHLCREALTRNICHFCGEVLDNFIKDGA